MILLIYRKKKTLQLDTSQIVHWFIFCSLIHV